MIPLVTLKFKSVTELGIYKSSIFTNKTSLTSNYEGINSILYSAMDLDESRLRRKKQNLLVNIFLEEEKEEWGKL